MEGLSPRAGRCHTRRAFARRSRAARSPQARAGHQGRLSDGDTVHVSLADHTTFRIRLDGIDAPEKGEPYSNDARNATRVMLFMRSAEIRGTSVDRYGRLVARIVVGGTDTSIELVERGLACHFTRYSDDRQ